MNKIDKTGQVEMEELKQIGLEFDAPQDEYSYQSGSGSIIGGKLGEQEYGITSYDNVIEGDAQDRNGNTIEEESYVGLPGESQWSQERVLQNDEIFDKDDGLLEVSDNELQQLIEDRIIHHPDLRRDSISVSVQHAEVTLEGEVRSDSEKVRVNDIIAALPGVLSIENNLEIRR